MTRIKINNIDFLVSSSLSVLEACSFVGIQIPRFCYHENLSVAGNCRMCLVEVEKAPKPVASCALPVSNNMSIYTDSPSVKKARENILETLLLNHPLDCPICDQGGECDLQDQTKIFGGDYSRFYLNKRSVEDKPYGTFIKTIMTRCIHCTRCVRFSDEVAGTSSFGTFNRGQNTEIGPYTKNIFESEISGNVIDLCPVGALTSKTYAYKARPWELRCQETIDYTDSLCSPILVNFKESEVVRIQPKYDNSLKNSIISDKIRFSFDSLKRNRIQELYQLKDNTFQKINWNAFFEFFKVVTKKKKVTFLINENSDLALMSILKRLEGFFSFKVCSLSSINTNNCINTNFLTYNINTCLKNNDFNTCILIASNLKIEATLINTKVRLKYNKHTLNIISSGLYYPNTYPINFINLDTSKVIEFFEGRLLNSKNIIKSLNTLLIFGPSFQKTINSMSPMISSFNTICPTGSTLTLGLRPNFLGKNFLNIYNITTQRLNNSDIIFCINLEDTICVRKLLKNKNYIWYNTHGSYLASKADFILPSLTFLENCYMFIDNLGNIKKTQVVIKGFKKSAYIKDFLELFSKKKSLSVWFSFILENINYKTINLKFSSFEFFMKSKTSIKKTLIKSSLEDFYQDSTYTKNSILLSKRSQEIKKSISNFSY